MMKSEFRGGEEVDRSNTVLGVLVAGQRPSGSLFGSELGVEILDHRLGQGQSRSDQVDGYSVGTDFVGDQKVSVQVAIDHGSPLRRCHVGEWG